MTRELRVGPQTVVTLMPGDYSWKLADTDQARLVVCCDGIAPRCSADVQTEALSAQEPHEPPSQRPPTAGVDKNYDTAELVAGCRERRCVPHVAQNNTNRRSAIDGRRAFITRCWWRMVIRTRWCPAATRLILPARLPKCRARTL